MARVFVLLLSLIFAHPAFAEDKIHRQGECVNLTVKGVEYCFAYLERWIDSAEDAGEEKWTKLSIGKFLRVGDQLQLQKEIDVPEGYDLDFQWVDLFAALGDGSNQLKIIFTIQQAVWGVGSEEDVRYYRQYNADKDEFVPTTFVEGLQFLGVEMITECLWVERNGKKLCYAVGRDRMMSDSEVYYESYELEELSFDEADVGDDLFQRPRFVRRFSIYDLNGYQMENRFQGLTRDPNNQDQLIMALKSYYYRSDKDIILTRSRVFNFNTSQMVDLPDQTEEVGQ